MIFPKGMVTAAALMLTACYQSHNDWENLDYTSVYRAYENRQNDMRYKPPSILGCIDDDLINCR
jgi:hypothetical protein